MPVHRGVQRIIFPALPWEVTYGPFDGTTAGEQLHIGYTSNFPVDEATLILADGRELVLTIAGGVLSVVLPPDTPDGWAGVRLHNTRGETRTDVQVVLLHGVTVAPPPGQPPAGGPAARRRRPKPTPEAKTVTIGSRVTVASATRVRAWRAIRDSLVASSETRVRARQSSALHITAASVTRLRGAVSASATVGTVGETAVARRDGPALEEALLLGDLVLM